MTFRQAPIALILLALGALFVMERMAEASSCPAPSSIGVPSARADTGAVAYDCRGQGETFLAVDTLITSIRVWRPAQVKLDVIPRYIFITGMRDSSDVPNTFDVLLRDTLAVGTVGDGIHPVEYRFEYDPPFALPRAGRFFLDVLAQELSAYGVSAATGNPYAAGRMWWTGPVFSCPVPGTPHLVDENLDLVFSITFCPQSGTPAKRTTWGAVKVVYR